MKLVRVEAGEGFVFFLGRKMGSPYVGADWGFSGYEHRHGRAYRFLTPTISVGRLFSDGQGRRIGRRVLVPLAVYDRRGWLTSWPLTLAVTLGHTAWRERRRRKGGPR